MLGFRDAYAHDPVGSRVTKTAGSDTKRYVYHVSDRRIEVEDVSIAMTFFASHDVRTRRIATTEDVNTKLSHYDGATNSQEATPGIPANKEVVR